MAFYGFVWNAEIDPKSGEISLPEKHIDEIQQLQL